MIGVAIVHSLLQLQGSVQRRKKGETARVVFRNRGLVARKTLENENPQIAHASGD